MLQYTAYFILAPLAAIVSFGVLVYAWRYRASEEMPALLWLMFTVIGWLACNIMELAAPTEESTLLWAKVGYFFVTSTTLTWFRFALRYTHKFRWLKPARFATLCIIPALTIILVLTNEIHAFIWHTYTFIPIDNYMVIHITRHGIGYWVHIVYGYGLVLAGAFLIIRQSFTSFNLYRQQSIWLATGSLIPIIGNIIYSFDVIPGLTKDYTSVTFAAAGIVFAIGMFRHHLFELHPIARDAVIEGMSDAMIVLDTRDRIIDVNAAALKIIGQDADAVIGQCAGQILARWSPLVEQFRETTSTQIDITIEDATGQRHYDLRISPLKNHGERISGRLVVLRDMTARKQAEVALRERTEELEARNEQLDAFAHTVAHDIKDPLTAVVGYSSMLQEFHTHLEIDELMHYLAMIIQTSAKLTKVVDALLLLASVYRLNESNFESINMHTLITGVRQRLADLIHTSGAVILEPEAWPPVNSYSPWIEEIWVNYISNAIKYGGDPHKGTAPQITVGYDRQGGDATIRFWVQDNGPGLSEAEKAQLFTQFTRLRGAPSEGHGLGLSIVRSIAEKLGGAAGVESDIGQGSRFWFTLPAADEA